MGDDLKPILRRLHSDPEYFGEGYGIAVKENNTELLKMINKGLREIKANGMYDKIYHAYFP